MKENTEFHKIGTLDEIMEAFNECVKQLEEKEKEIERLKEMKLHTEKYASEMEDKYISEKHKNNKAIEYIKDKDFINYKKGLGNLERMLKHRQDLLDILEGKKLFGKEPEYIICEEFMTLEGKDNE